MSWRLKMLLLLLMVPLLRVTHVCANAMSDLWVTLPAEKARAQATATDLLTTFTVSHGDDTIHAWRAMLPRIWATYRDGYVFSGLDQPTVSVQRMFYPEWWLQQVGYFNPMNLNHDKDAILFAADPAGEGATFSSPTLLPLVVGMAVGLLAGKYLGQKEARREGYSSIASTHGAGSAYSAL
jgi:hypothetical protein